MPCHQGGNNPSREVEGAMVVTIAKAGRVSRHMVPAPC
jgi:hypothetical protein